VLAQPPESYPFISGNQPVDNYVVASLVVELVIVIREEV
jgi:hypothetical protein